ncbi:hypothetical protein STAS_14541, partial [Striga asiatica]
MGDKSPGNAKSSDLTQVQRQAPEQWQDGQSGVEGTIIRDQRVNHPLRLTSGGTEREEKEGKGKALMIVESTMDFEAGQTERPTIKNLEHAKKGHTATWKRRKVTATIVIKQATHKVEPVEHEANRSNEQVSTGLDGPHVLDEYIVEVEVEEVEVEVEEVEVEVEVEEVEVEKEMVVVDEGHEEDMLEGPMVEVEDVVDEAEEETLVMVKAVHGEKTH